MKSIWWVTNWLGWLSEGLAAKALIKEMAEEMTAIKLNAQFIDLFKFGLITGNQSNWN